jgi:hypothetical protein
MKVISIKDPWATLIIRGVKDVENRRQQTHYRGPLAIQVSQTYDMGAHRDPVAAATMVDDDRVRRLTRADMPRGVIIGVVDLVGCHRHFRTGNGCETSAAHMRATICSLWGQPDVWHYELANPRMLAEPILMKGSLGIRSLDPALVAEIERQL